MKCLNCGFCCVKYDVMIIHPDKAYNENMIIEDLDPKYIIHKGYDIICPHLDIINNKSYCKIHKYNWYKLTPCYQFSQIESNEESLCRVGNAISNQQIKFKLNDFKRMEL